MDKAFAIQKQVTTSVREGAELRLRLLDVCLGQIVEAVQVISRCFTSGNKLIIFGNGGSAADAQHIAAEFTGRFSRDRMPLPAIALTTDTSAITAIGNDYGFEYIFARQIKAVGKKGDVVIAISTSGESPNILAAVRDAKHLGITTIGLSGGEGGALMDLSDICISVPSKNTPRIQECHLAIEHMICEGVEMTLWDWLSKEEVD